MTARRRAQYAAKGKETHQPDHTQPLDHLKGPPPTSYRLPHPWRLAHHRTFAIEAPPHRAGARQREERVIAISSVPSRAQKLSPADPTEATSPCATHHRRSSRTRRSSVPIGTLTFVAAELHLCDVFAQGPLSGNSLAVVVSQQELAADVR